MPLLGLRVEPTYEELIKQVSKKRPIMYPNEKARILFNSFEFNQFKNISDVQLQQQIYQKEKEHLINAVISRYSLNPSATHAAIQALQLSPYNPEVSTVIPASELHDVPVGISALEFARRVSEFAGVPLTEEIEPTSPRHRTHRPEETVFYNEDMIREKIPYAFIEREHLRRLEAQKEMEKQMMGANQEAKEAAREVVLKIMENINAAIEEQVGPPRHLFEQMREGITLPKDMTEQELVGDWIAYRSLFEDLSKNKSLDEVEKKTKDHARDAAKDRLNRIIKLFYSNESLIKQKIDLLRKEYDTSTDELIKQEINKQIKCYESAYALVLKRKGQIHSPEKEPQEPRRPYAAGRASSSRG